MDVRPQFHQLACQRRQTFGLVLCKTPFDDQVLAFDSAQVAQRGGEHVRGRRIGTRSRHARAQDAQVVDPAGALRAGDARRQTESPGHCDCKGAAAHH